MDPLGKFLSGLIGFAIGTHQERRREEIIRLNDERAVRVANRTYARLYAMLRQAKIGGKGQQFRLADILGEPALSEFSLQVAEWVRKELESQP